MLASTNLHHARLDVVVREGEVLTGIGRKRRLLVVLPDPLVRASRHVHLPHFDSARRAGLGWMTTGALERSPQRSRVFSRIRRHDHARVAEHARNPRERLAALLLGEIGVAAEGIDGRVGASERCVAIAVAVLSAPRVLAVWALTSSDETGPDVVSPVAMRLPGHRRWGGERGRFVVCVLRVESV